MKVTGEECFQKNMDILPSRIALIIFDKLSVRDAKSLLKVFPKFERCVKELMLKRFEHFLGRNFGYINLDKFWEQGFPGICPTYFKGDYIFYKFGYILIYRSNTITGLRLSLINGRYRAFPTRYIDSDECSAVYRARRVSNLEKMYYNWFFNHRDKMSFLEFQMKRGHEKTNVVLP